MASALGGAKYWSEGGTLGGITSSGAIGNKNTASAKYWLAGLPITVILSEAVSGAGSAAGTGAASGTGAILTPTVGSAAGTSDAPGIGQLATSGPGGNTGAGKYWFEGNHVPGIGRDDIVRGGAKYWFEGLPHPILFGQHVGVGTAAGTGSADAVGNLLLLAVGTADGSSTVLGYPPRARAYAQIFG